MGQNVSKNPNLKENIIQAIGNTPLVRLNRVTAGLSSTIYAKCEFMNPGGSVKDRIGWWLIEDAEKKGLLKPGGTVVEATSGNTGMGLAITAAVKGYKSVFVLPDKMSAEKIKTLRAFGARVVVTPTAVGPTDPRSHYSVSERIAEETPNAYLANQYHNLANREAHYNTTGPEIWEQTGGQVDVFVAGMGTGGTITGVGMYLKEKKPSVQIVGADPVGSILHDYFKTGTMPTPQSYKVEGIGEDMLPANLDFKILDEIVQVTDQESFGMTRKLLLQEGLFIGPSCGAAVVAAVKYAKTLKEPKTIVVVLPDSGGRYLSKVYDDDWMRENGFLEPDDLGQVRDLVNTVGAIQPITATAEHTVGMVIDIMRDKGISQLPVVKAGKVVGIVAEADVLKALVDGRVQKDSSVAPLVGFGFAVVSLDDPVSLVSAHVSEGKMPILMVNGEVKSIITKIDLITYLGRRR